MTKRVILVVLDSVGIGAMPDAADYGDEGSNTLSNIAGQLGRDLKLPNLIDLGISNIEGVKYLPKKSNPYGAYGRAAEISAGKDTTTGHWEISGVTLDNAFPTYLSGFPEIIIAEFEKEAGTHVLGNKPASGTEIIKELGDVHVKTGYPIVYTSADSVFQIAAHEDIISLEKLYEMCETARNILTGEHGVGRVIARPFNGSSGNYKRTEGRKDYSLKPLKPTMLDFIKSAGLEVKGIGKIEDIFAGEGLTDSVHTTNNRDGMNQIITYMKESFEGLIFANLVDFDMLYGHRNDVEGYAKALEEFDCKVPFIKEAMRSEDILIITADHGCDPTTPSTDHSREYIPIIVYGQNISCINIGTRHSFSDIGKTICDLLGINAPIKGDSFKNLIIG